MNKTTEKIGVWMVDGETGMSSKYLAALILGSIPERVSYPYDPADFNRCVLMCEFVGYPIEEVVWLASKRDKHWAGLHEHLPQLLRLWREECVGDQWRATKLYNFMQEIYQYVEKKSL